jgi:ribosomal protein L21E
MSAVNDERRQVLPSKVIWDGTIDRFEVFRNNVEDHYRQIYIDNLLDSSFQEPYLERGVECYVDFLDEVPSSSQIKKDARALYGALLSVCQSSVGPRILMENRDKQDNIRLWCQLLQQYETGGNRNFRIKILESVINTLFHRNYRGRLVKWIQDYKDAFTVHRDGFMGKRLGMMMKSRSVTLYRMLKILVLLIQFLKNQLVISVFIETCNFLRSHAIRLDQQCKEEDAREIHNARQS